MKFIEAVKTAAKGTISFGNIKWLLFGIALSAYTMIMVVIIAIAGAIHPLLGLISILITIVSLVFFCNFCDEIRLNWSLEK